MGGNGSYSGVFEGCEKLENIVLLNIRGRAIQYNPVTFCYLVISKEDVLCFIDSDNLSELKNVYKKVSFYGYDEFSDYVSSIKNKDVLFEYSSFAAEQQV